MEWISTKDRLPKYGVPVLVVVDDVVQHITYMLDGSDDCRDWFESYHFESDTKFWHWNASHWMPIPEAPKQ